VPPQIRRSMRKLTDEERNHLSRGDAFAHRDCIMHTRKAGPDCCNHDLHDVTAIDGLNREPEHCQDHSGDDSHCASYISLHHPSSLLHFYSHNPHEGRAGVP